MKMILFTKERKGGQKKENKKDMEFEKIAL